MTISAGGTSAVVSVATLDDDEAVLGEAMTLTLTLLEYGQPDRLFAVHRLSHHLELPGLLEDLLQAHPHDRVIVDDHHPGPYAR